MRAWLRLLTLLSGFAGSRYVWYARIERPVPIERRIPPDEPGAGLRRTAHWWRP